MKEKQYQLSPIYPLAYSKCSFYLCAAFPQKRKDNKAGQLNNKFSNNQSKHLI